jgi:kynureninase
MEVAAAQGLDVYSKEFAAYMDATDPMAHKRACFHIPKGAKEGEEALYFTGNSLGLLPKKAQVYVNEEMVKWGNMGVKGHVSGERPWVKIDEFVTPMMMEVVGAANEEEVACMNTLTVNLHLMMTSFYRPTEARHKILIEADAFCSDHHVVRSQIELHGRDNKDSLIELEARAGEVTFFGHHLNNLRQC